MAVLGGAFILAGCGAAPQDSTSLQTRASQTPLVVDNSTSQASLYLMGRFARQQSDLSEAARFFSQALRNESRSSLFLRQAYFAHYLYGDIEMAAQIARLIEGENFSLSITSEPAAMIAWKQQDYQAVRALSNRLEEDDTTRFLGQMLIAWADFAEGRVDAGIAGLRQLGRGLVRQHQNGDRQMARSPEGLPFFIHLHLAEMNILAGRAREARKNLYILEEASSLPAQIELRQIALWQQLGDRQRASDIIRYGLSQRFFQSQILAELDTTPPLTLNQAVARSVLFLNWVHLTAQNAPLLGARAHMALYLDDSLDDARFVIAQLAEADGQLARSAAFLETMNPAGPWAGPAFYIQIEQWRAAKRMDHIISALKDKTDAHPADALLWQVLGDIYRQVKRYEDAISAYHQSLDLGNQLGSTYRSLGISYQNQGDSQLAEDYLRQAIARNPDDAHALNYLGYWFADEKRNLNEAFQLIEQAVALRPNNGYFADSLGWVHYRLGAYDKALIWLEKAFQLEPGDPVITDHLGDVYWQLGRQDEARFKWQLALDQLGPDLGGFSPTHQRLFEDVQLKLKNGL